MPTSSSPSPPFLLFLVAWGLELLGPALDALLGFEDPISTCTCNTSQVLKAEATEATMSADFTKATNPYSFPCCAIHQVALLQATWPPFTVTKLAIFTHAHDERSNDDVQADCAKRGQREQSQLCMVYTSLPAPSALMKRLQEQKTLVQQKQAVCWWFFPLAR